MTQFHPIKFPPQKVLDFLGDAFHPVFNALRAAHGVEPEQPRVGPPVTAQEARAAWDEWGGYTPQPEPPREREPRRPTLARVAKQAGKAGIEVARYEVKPDGSVVVITGKGEPAAPENPWLVELRTKETKR